MCSAQSPAHAFMAKGKEKEMREIWPEYNGKTLRVQGVKSKGKNGWVSGRVKKEDRVTRKAFLIAFKCDLAPSNFAH